MKGADVAGCSAVGSVVFVSCHLFTFLVFYL